MQDLRGGLLDQLLRQEIGREAGQKERAGHAGGGDGHPHDVGADPAHGRVVGFRIIEKRQILNDRIDGAAAASCIRRREGRENGIGSCDGVSKVSVFRPIRFTKANAIRRPGRSFRSRAQT